MTFNTAINLLAVYYCNDFSLAKIIKKIKTEYKASESNPRYMAYNLGKPR